MAILSGMSGDSYHRAIVFGGPKSGKTELVGKLAEQFNLKWFDLEKGYNTLFKLPVAWQDHIDLISLPDTRDYPIAIETMLKVLKGDPVKLCEQHGKVNCGLCNKAGIPLVQVHLNALTTSDIVVVDSMTQLANSAMAHITRTEGDEYKYDWDDYRRQGTIMDKVLSYVQQAKYNVVVITHEVEAELEDGRKKIVPVAGTTNFSRNTAKYFDHVIYCEVKNKKHNFGSSTTYGNSVITGSRTDIEIEKATTPSLLDIFNSTNKPAAAKPTQGAAAIKSLGGLAAKKDTATEPTPELVAEVSEAKQQAAEVIEEKLEAAKQQAAKPAEEPITSTAAAASRARELLLRARGGK